MAIKKPLVIGSDGLPQQLQSGDSIAVPTSGGESVQQTNANAGSIVIGCPVYTSAADAVNKAQANASGTSKVTGLVADTSIAASASGTIQTDGVLTATTTQWDAVAGTTGGLTAGTLYFLDPANAGKITATVPTTVGQYVVCVGKALSTTELLIHIAYPILL